MITEKSPLVGQILLAMPGIQDPRFSRAAVFMCAHDTQGAMGLVLSDLKLGATLSGLMSELGIQNDGTGAARTPVHLGGPVETGRGFVLHTPDFQQKDTIVLNDEYSVTATVDVLRAIAEGKGPEKFLFFLGYAGWQAGQLEKELQDNAWLVAPAQAEIVFDMLPGEKWDAGMAAIGIKPGQLTGFTGRA